MKIRISYKNEISIITLFILMINPLLSYSQSLVQLPNNKGSLIRYEKFNSQFVDARTIDVWLPKNYKKSKKYSVLYMHDGQMLFDSSTTWNKQSWNLGSHITQLLDEKKIQNCIVVGIYNNGTKRHFEYAPQKALVEFLDKSILDSLLIEIKGQKAPKEKELSPLLADNYLKFIVQELKPFIDKNYPTLNDRAHTSIMGSSMGGLISMYALCEYPDVFGSAACLSTHWPLLFRKDNPAPQALLNYLNKYLPPAAKGNRIYFDCGTATLDALYPEYQSQADLILKSKAYKTNQFMSRIFPGEEHNEKAWDKRLDLPLMFLLGK